MEIENVSVLYFAIMALIGEIQISYDLYVVKYNTVCVCAYNCLVRTTKEVS